LSGVMGGRPLDPVKAARRMYVSRQFEARMADGEKGDLEGLKDWQSGLAPSAHECAERWETC
jgi:hypothetical protein